MSAPDPAPPAAAEKQPRALSVLFFTEMWERFSFYGLQALLVLYMTKHLGFAKGSASSLSGTYSFLAYGLGIFGGAAADRLLGYKRAIILGGTLMMVGHFLMAIDRLPVFYTALGFLIFGVGLLKPNVSTVVGKLYREGDPRRDRGFTIFYVGINLGGFLAPLVCGYLGQNVGWHWGFACAGVGMAIGLVVFVAGQPLLGGVDMRPAPAAKKDGAAPELTKADWQRIAVLMIIWIFVTIFWAGYYQTWVSLTFWADEHTHLPMLPASLGGKQMPSSSITSYNSAYIIALAPLVSALWLRLSRRRREPPSSAKMVIGLFLLAACFAVMVVAAVVTGGKDASIAWLAGCYVLMTLGELLLSPVGLSLVTKLAPRGIGATLMGIWFLTLGVGFWLGGLAGNLWTRTSHAAFFGGWAALSLLAALVLLVLLPTIKRLAHGAD